MENIHWKFIIILGSIAAGLSLLIGILSGNRFSVVLIRFFISALIFFVLAFLIDLVVGKFFPDFFSEGSNEHDDNIDHNVDIVLEEENPHANAEVDEDRQSESGNGFVQEIEEVRQSYNAEAHSSAGSGEQPVQTSIDDLPSLDQYESVFTTPIETEEEAPVDPVSSRQTMDNIDVLGAEHSPEDVARAVRTILKKDRKG